MSPFLYFSILVFCVLHVCVLRVRSDAEVLLMHNSTSSPTQKLESQYNENVPPKTVKNTEAFEELQALEEMTMQPGTSGENEAEDDVISCPVTCSCSFNNTAMTLKVNSCRRPPDESDLEILFSDFQTIKGLEIVNSSLSKLPTAICNLTSLQQLDLSWNMIGSLEGVNSICIASLVRFNLSRNQITNFTKDLFQNCQVLENISISHNKLQYFDTGFYYLQNLTNLKTLDLRFNQLEYIDASALMMPANTHQGARIQLDDNIIWHFTNERNITIKRVPFHTKLALYLRRNKLEHVENANFVTLLSVSVENVVDLLRIWDSGFYLADNPWACDCEMYYLLEPLRPLIKIFKNFHDLAFLQIKCSSPPETSDYYIPDVPPQLFKCDIPPKYGCPSHCSCTLTPYNDTVSMQCQNHDLTTIPAQTPTNGSLELYLNHNLIRVVNPHPWFINVTVLDLSYNSISSIPKESLVALEIIQVMDLSNNNLISLPTGLISFQPYVNSTLFLSENPFTCTCDFKQYRDWLDTYNESIGDLEHIVCTKGKVLGKPIYLLKDSEFPCFWAVPLVVGLTCAAMVILSFVLVILIFYYRRELKVWFYLRWNLRTVREDDPNYVNDILTYDAFIACSGADQEWVQRVLLPLLENNKPAYKACVYWRNFSLGCTLIHLIETGMQKSATIILVLSREFFKREWCVFEIRAAVIEVMKNRNKKILLVLMEDFSEDEVDGNFKKILKKFDQVSMMDPFFKQKFWYLMPKSTISLSGACGEDNETAPLLGSVQIADAF